MRRVPRLLSLFLLLSLFTCAAFAQTKRPLTFADMISMKRVADAQIAPDGSKIAYVVNVINKEANRGKRSIWLVSAKGGNATEFITSDKNDDTPRWSPDGSRVAFLSTRAGAPQIFVANADGGNAHQVTNVPEGVSEFIWSPDGKSFAFVTDVYPECKDLKCVAEKSATVENSKVKAVVTDRLLYRHWDTFKHGKRAHLFVISAEANAEGSQPKDLTPGDYDVPPFSLGDPTAFAFSPDSRELCFARNTDKDEALSTNNDLFIIPVSGGEAKRITGENKGSDTTPRYSPDGKYIAYRSQARKGFESDRFRLMLYDRKAGTVRELSINFDRWVEDLAWLPDSKGLLLTSQERGRDALWLAPMNGDKFKRIINEGSNTGATVSADGKTFAFTRATMTMPNEVFKANADGSGVTQLSRTNAQLLAQLDLTPAEDFDYVGALKAKVHGFIVKPPNFDKSKKYPMILLIHGGPQGAWVDTWSFRWNPQMWAARGYVVAAINPHGSTGYGQAFTEQITGEWGGAGYDDLMKGTDHMIKLGYVDANRMGAAGGSFGGYMVNWINGHTDRFKALVSHASIFNAESMYATEELWFQEWEWKGAPWDTTSVYKKWSPHLFVKNFKTPTLVVHGELDYRVPIGEGLQIILRLTTTRRAVEVVVLPGRRSLGAEAAEQ